MKYGEKRIILLKKELPKEILYACRYNWDLPNIGAKQLVEMIKKYREGTASRFEKLIVNIFRSHVIDYQDREVWEYFFPDEEMPPPTRWWDIEWMMKPADQRD